MCEVELPPGASLQRTEKTMLEFYETIKDIPGIKNVTLVAGFSIISGASENVGFAIVTLDDWSERKTDDLKITAIRQKIMEAGALIPQAEIRAFQPPTIMGLGVTGGVSFAFRTNGADTPTQFEGKMNQLLGILNDKSKMPTVAYAFSGFTAKTPQLFLDIDRQKAEAMGVETGDILATLQSHLGSQYVNDFNIRGYSFKVKLQLESDDRSSIRNLEELLIPARTGAMVPLTAIARTKVTLGARKIERFQQNMSAGISVIPLPGASTREIMEQIETVVSRDFPREYSVSWTDMSYQEKNNDGKVLYLMAFAVLFGYLFLVAQYESWTIPLPVILSVAFASLGGLMALKVTGLLMDIYAQLGLIMLIGLCAKSTILMVEFSMQERQAGKTIAQSAVNGITLRYRAVLMTAWSFVIGVLPLLFASGAGAASRQVIGITTFWGMLTATVVGILFVPPMFSLFQKMLEKVNARKDQRKKDLN